MDRDYYDGLHLMRENVRLQFRNENLHKTVNESLEALDEKLCEVSMKKL